MIDPLKQELILELHVRARLQVALARMDGHQIDKSCMRFNDIVAEAMQWGGLGKVFSPAMARDALLTETIDQCVIGAWNYTGERFDPKRMAWMVSS